MPRAAGAAYQGLTAWQVAHDLEALRSALGEPNCAISATPTAPSTGRPTWSRSPQVGRMVLDGVADHTRVSLERWLLDNALTEERQFVRFRDWCEDGCALGDDDTRGVRRSARPRPPMPPPAGQETVNEREFLAAVQFGLMRPPAWPTLAAALRKAADGDATGLTKLREPLPEKPGNVSGAASCATTSCLTCPATASSSPSRSACAPPAPRIGWIHGRYQVARCLGMGAGPAYPPHPLRAPGVPPVLIAIGDVDSNTPNLAAEHMGRIASQSSCGPAW